MAVKLVRGWTDPRPHLLLAVIGRFLFFVVRWTTTIKEVRFGDDWNSNTIIGVGAPTICSRHHSHPHNNSLFQKTMWPEINLVFTQRLPCIQGHRGAKSLHSKGVEPISVVSGWNKFALAHPEWGLLRAEPESHEGNLAHRETETNCVTVVLNHLLVFVLSVDFFFWSVVRYGEFVQRRSDRKFTPNLLPVSSMRISSVTSVPSVTFHTTSSSRMGESSLQLEQNSRIEEE